MEELESKNSASMVSSGESKEVWKARYALAKLFIILFHIYLHQNLNLNLNLYVVYLNLYIYIL